MTTNPRTLLDQYELQPKKSLGQNFLHDPNTLEKIVNTAELMPDDTVVEIGPGTGTLTKLLAQKARHVISIEIDASLRPVLEQELAPYDNVVVMYEDFLKVDVLRLVGAKDFIVVANVPYYITSKILRNLLDSHRRPRRIVLTVQMEVAERIIAEPGDMSLLAVSVQFYGKPQIVTRLKPGVFWPRPDVDSAVLRIDCYDDLPLDVPDSKTFFRVVRAGFSQKRKQLKNSLSGGLGIKSRAAGDMLDEAGIDATRRAETLSLEEWAALTRAYAAMQD
jgi:16S rRNA (adenine1518-N6/adenine1519-N6)-dimethyltransferase